MALVEVGKGCGRGCRFCLEGQVYLARCAIAAWRSLRETIGKMAKESTRVGLVGACVSDYPWIGDLMDVVEEAARQLNNAFALRIDLRRDALGNGPMQLSLGSARFDISRLLAQLPEGRLSTIKIPLRCFADAGSAMTAVTEPFKLEGSAGYRLSLRQVVVEAVGEPLACPS